MGIVWRLIIILRDIAKACVLRLCSSAAYHTRIIIKALYDKNLASDKVTDFADNSLLYTIHL
jgi:hypothetical protein